MVEDLRDCAAGPAAPYSPNRPAAGGVLRGLALPAVLVLTAAAAVWIDCPLALFCTGACFPECLRDVATLCEVFGHGLGVAMILLVIYQLAPGHRYGLARVTACALGAGLMANVVKLCVSRIRPDNFFLAGGGSADSGLATFSGWLPLLSIDSTGQSFPSAHMATAVGLAIGLSWLVPRGRWVFPTLALLVGVQRLQSGAHYLSDLCCGAAIGILTARACMSQRCLARHFDRLEGWYARRQRRLATGQSSPSLESRPARELVVPEGLPARRAA